MKKMKILITCEHGGNRIPNPYRKLFGPHAKLLRTHRGLDIGALELFNTLKRGFADASFYSLTSRLLVEPNRSPRHPALYSFITKPLSDEVKKEIFNRHYLPHRKSIEDQVRRWVAKKFQVIHISAHSFTPRLNGESRRADIGLLYDSRRRLEKEFCRKWKSSLLMTNRTLRVRMNHPYRGNADGLTTYLRRCFPSDSYLGFELEVNQAFPLGPKREWRSLLNQIAKSLSLSLAE